jgi:large subunit ribosomal protein L6
MVEIPQGVSVQVDGQTVTTKGPQGEISRTFPKPALLSTDGKNVEVSVKDPALAGTFKSLLGSMLKGVSVGYKKNLKVLYAHFPISIEVKGKDILIKNFLGEKQPRRTKVVGNTKVEVKGQKVAVSGPDKEAVGQTTANMIRAVRIKKKDARIFQDGIYASEE